MSSETQQLARYPAMPLWPGSDRALGQEPVQLRPGNLVDQEIIVTELVTGHQAALAGGRCHRWTQEGEKAGDWQNTASRRHGWKTLGMSHTIYGQVLRSGANSRYRRQPQHDNLLVYGVRSDDSILSWDETEQLAEALNLQLVPLVFRGRISDRDEMDDFLRLALRQPSQLHGARAGLAIRQSRRLAASEYHLYSARLKA